MFRATEPMKTIEEFDVTSPDSYTGIVRSGAFVYSQKICLQLVELIIQILILLPLETCIIGRKI